MALQRYFLAMARVDIHTVDGLMRARPGVHAALHPPST
jgi:hypothetical protein